MLTAYIRSPASFEIFLILFSEVFGATRSIGEIFSFFKLLQNSTDSSRGKSGRITPSISASFHFFMKSFVPILRIGL